ncbi:MAG: beta-ketoacyl-ACP synthase 3 [Phycisphaeraceae bacterium]|nr:beta-ketoacyl-ACP synthase 3 [Phycisphaeraceae bacterium]
MARSINAGRSATTVETASTNGRGLPTLERSQLIDLYRAMVAAREVDRVESELVTRGEAFFHVSGAGHEGGVALMPALRPEDWLHPHYRDKALMIARGIPPEMFFHSLLCNEAGHSKGRQMSAHLSDPSRRVLSLVGPVGNNALQAAGLAAAVKDDPARPIVVTALGDGSSQEGEVLEGIGEVVRDGLPVLFVIQDNGFSISTLTPGKTFYDLPDREADEFYGLKIHRLDGRDVRQSAPRLMAITESMRQNRRPAIVVMKMDRLANHTNADDERVYRTKEEIERVRKLGDPIARLRSDLMEMGLSEKDLWIIEQKVRSDVHEASERSLQSGDPTPTFEAGQPYPERLTRRSNEYLGDSSTPRVTMIEAIRDVLFHRMSENPDITLFGEDLEDPKGDVFGVTRGLTKAYPGRVRNYALSESTIVGVSIGRALAGKQPVAFLQFADFIPLAFNQIACELGSMDWRTDGGWTCPVIIMVACGAYRPGLGPFHAHTFESVCAHVPGVDVFMPSNAGDAAGLLNAAFESKRPTIFFYPKVCLNDREATTSADVGQQLAIPGTARLMTRGDHLTLVTWGSTMGIARKVVAALEPLKIGVELIDLRSIMPWDREAVIASVRKTRKLIVLHEDNMTCGFGAEVVATVSEAVEGPITVRRITRPDTYVPCNFPNQLEVLPSFKRTLEAAAEMLDLDLVWKVDERVEDGCTLVEAIGSSPADQAVTVVNWSVKVGDEVTAGQPLADLEADKAVVELTSPEAGIVDTLLVPEGLNVKVGTPLLRLRSEPVNGARRRKPITREEPGEPILSRRRSRPVTKSVVRSTTESRTEVLVGMSSIYASMGSLTLTNEQLVKGFPARTCEDIMRRTGIESRPRMAPHQTTLSISVEAAKAALVGEKLPIDQVSAIICATSTPLMVTPSMACLIQHELSKDVGDFDAPAHDVLAACTGYLYALAAGYDFIQAQPDARVLIITAEGLSRAVNPADFDTAIIFGDAATATVLYGPEHMSKAKATLHRPVLSAKGENGDILKVPNTGCGFIEMDGRKVFAEAVRQMLTMLERACDRADIGVNQIDLFVPHQANGRIIEAIRTRLRVPEERVVNAVRHYGNTSSSSIPLCLRDLMDKQKKGSRLGLCAFGGGFTFGAAVVERLGEG